MSKQNNNSKPISVNWHFWPWCNMKCRFCFATFNDVKEVIPKDLALTVPKMLREAGTEKITFVGGEPMLCPYIGELLIESKAQGLITKIVSNGSRFTEEFLSNYAQYIDYITLSIDSPSNITEKDLGRGWGNHVDNILETAKLIKSHKIILQINSTITKLNWHEDMHVIMDSIKPQRWKVFQVLKVDGQNNVLVDDLLITKEEFDFFVDRHKDIPYAIFENNDLITGSYIMLDPIGRFFDNLTGKHYYSETIFSAGITSAFKQVIWQKEKFMQREGFYYKKTQKESLLMKKSNILRLLNTKRKSFILKGERNV